MIIENKQTEIESPSEITAIKATIDAENIGFLATILSSNLYSQPCESFFREIVSNAWDSHVAAGKTNKPVIININQQYVTIRDYGTGLSKEEFENVYCKIGTSTKRDTNDYIGAFGIGKWSMLAVADSAIVTSFYNGTKYEYLISKDNGIITTILISESPTEEENGLAVNVELKNSLQFEISRALKSLLFFPNVYVKIEGNNALGYDFNNVRVKRYKSFSVCDVLRSSRYAGVHYLYALIGNVLYKLDYGEIHYTAKKFTNDDTLQNMLKCDLCFNFNIGELDVTPNRENIIYNDRSKLAISNKIQGAIQELKEIEESMNIVDITDLSEYRESITHLGFIDLITTQKTTFSEGNWEYKPNNTYKGKLRSPLFNEYVSIIGCREVPSFKASYINGKFSVKGGFLRARSVFYDVFIAIIPNLTPRVKTYLQSLGLLRSAVIQNMSEQAFKLELCKGLMPCTSSPENDAITEILEEISSDIYHRIYDNIPIVTKEDVDKYIADSKTTGTYKSAVKTFVLNTIDIQSAYSFSIKKEKTYNNFLEFIDNLPNFGKLFMHRGQEITFEQRQVYRVLQSLGYRLFWVNNQLYDTLVKYMKTNTTKLKNIHFDSKAILEFPDYRLERYIAIARMKAAMLADGTLVGDHLPLSHYYWTKSSEVLKLLDKYKLNRESSLIIDEYFTNYTIKSEEGKYLEKLLEQNVHILNERIRFRSLTSDVDINNYCFIKSLIRTGYMVKGEELFRTSNHKTIKSIQKYV